MHGLLPDRRGLTSTATSGLCKTASSSGTGDRRSKAFHVWLIPTAGKMP